MVDCGDTVNHYLKAVKGFGVGVFIGPDVFQMLCIEYRRRLILCYVIKEHIEIVLLGYALSAL